MSSDETTVIAVDEETELLIWLYNPNQSRPKHKAPQYATPESIKQLSNRLSTALSSSVRSLFNVSDEYVLVNQPPFQHQALPPNTTVSHSHPVQPQFENRQVMGLYRHARQPPPRIRAGELPEGDKSYYEQKYAHYDDKHTVFSTPLPTTPQSSPVKKYPQQPRNHPQSKQSIRPDANSKTGNNTVSNQHHQQHHQQRPQPLISPSLIGAAIQDLIATEPYINTTLANLSLLGSKTTFLQKQLTTASNRLASHCHGLGSLPDLEELHLSLDLFENQDDGEENGEENGEEDGEETGDSIEKSRDEQ